MRTCLDRRHEVYRQSQQRVVELEQAGCALVLAPKQPLDIRRFEKHPDRLGAVYDLGLAAGQEALSRIGALQKK